MIRSMRRESGGPAEGLRLLLRGYQQEGHEAEIATLDPPGTEFAEVPVTVHALGRKVFGFGYSPALKRFLESEAGRFDGIVLHGMWQYHGLAALRTLPGKHRYTVFTHGMLDPWFNRTYPLKMLKKLPYWFLVERRLLQRADAVLFTSTAEANLACQSFPLPRWHAEVVPYGTLGPPGESAVERAAFEQRIPELRGEPFLLYAGRMHAKKGCDLLLEAYRAVSQEVELPRLVMAGPDETGISRELKAFVAEKNLGDRVLWPGMLTGAAKWGAFRAAEAFVLPSHQENFGIAVAEALSCRTPVLISDQVNIHEDVYASQAGLVQPDTLEGTKQLLRAWAAMSPLQRATMRENGFRCWQTRFNSAGTAPEIVRIFQRPPQHPAGAAVGVTLRQGQGAL